jgi:hypothetical protein
MIASQDRFDHTILRTPTASPGVASFDPRLRGDAARDDASGRRSLASIREVQESMRGPRFDY